MNGYWPAFSPQGKLTRDEGMKLEKVFSKKIFGTKGCVEVYDFSKTYFRMCTDINNYVPVRPSSDDPDYERQWGCGYRDDTIAQFKKIYMTENLLFKIKVKMIQLILSRTEINLGLIFLLMLEVQYPIIFMIIIITMKDWRKLFVVQR